MKFLLLLLLFLPVPSEASESSQSCITFNGVAYCDHSTTITIGSTEVPISNPYALLTAAQKSEVRKIFWGTVYKYPVVVQELAKQVGLTEAELVELLKDETEAWNALYHLPALYYNVTQETGVDYQIDTLFQQIVRDISDDIESQLTDYFYLTPVIGV